MKDLLILLCIGIIAALLFHERSQWMLHTAEPVLTVPEARASPPPKGEVLRADPPPAVSSTPDKNAQANLVAQSQRAAVTKYPALGVPDSEINIRFAYRYKTLVADHSPRLQDPTWPMQLADECAVDSSVHPVAKLSPPPLAVPSRKTGAIPLNVAAPTGTPARSLRLLQPAAAVAQTLVFHPPAGVGAQVPPVPPPTTTAKPAGLLPFVTLDAVNQSSGNNYAYNYNSYWWYDISFRQSVGIAINVRNMSRDPAAVNLRWIFFARRTSNNERFVFGASGKELDLSPGQTADVPAASPVVQSREVSDYWVGGSRYLSGSKYEGWLVQLVDRTSNRIIKQTGSTSYLEDLARKTDFSALIEDFKKAHDQGNPRL